MPIKPVWRSNLWLGAIILVFAVPAAFLSADTMVGAASALQMVACFFGLYRWGPTAVRVYREGASEPWHHGVLAICVVLAFLIVARLFQITFIALDRPEWLLLIPISALITYGIFIGVALFSAATKIDGEKPSKATSIITAILAALAVFASSVLPFLIAKGGVIISTVERFCAMLVGRL